MARWWPSRKRRQALVPEVTTPVELPYGSTVSSEGNHPGSLEAPYLGLLDPTKPPGHPRKWVEVRAKLSPLPRNPQSQNSPIQRPGPPTIPKPNTQDQGFPDSQSDSSSVSSASKRQRDQKGPISQRSRGLSDPSNRGLVGRIYRPFQQRRRLIVGIDYGTSHSGVAWALVDPADTSSREVKITTVRRWPGRKPGDYTAGKVSSELSYDYNGFHWGFDISDDVPDSKKLKWVKLLLEPESKLKDKSTIDRSREQLRVEGRTEVDAASEYLACLWGHAKATIIKEITQEVFDFADKTIVLTIPALWSPKAKENSYLVAVKAGLTGDRYSLRIVTEPEAAAIAVLNDKAREFEPRDCFVVCDAGGGTVDLTSYQVQKIEPLCLQERVVGDGGLCGSVFLDIAFKRHLRTRLTEEIFDKITPESMTRIMHEFESCIKRQFSCEDGRTYHLYMPGVLNCSDSIRLTRDHLMPIFDTVCSDIEMLIDKQVKALKEQKISAKALILVGGFGGNKYLFERLQALYPGDGMEIIQPENSLGAVSTGAVLCGLRGSGNTVNLHLSRMNIGVSCNEPFREGYHLPEDTYYCRYAGIYKAKGVLWVVSKGDKIRTGEKSVFYFTWIHDVKDSDSDLQKVKVEAHLVRSNEEKPPTRRTPAVQNFVTIKFSIDRSAFKNTPQRQNLDGKSFWYIDYEVEMIMGPAMLQFSCIINGVVRDSTSVVYHAAENDY